MQAELWIVTAAAVAMVMLSVAADHRRARRRDRDGPGWVPWPLVMIVSIIVAALSAAMALHS